MWTTNVLEQVLEQANTLHVHFIWMIKINILFRMRLVKWFNKSGQINAGSIRLSAGV